MPPPPNHLAAQLAGFVAGVQHLRLQALFLHRQALDQAHHALCEPLQQLHKRQAAGVASTMACRAACLQMAAAGCACGLLQPAGVAGCCLLQTSSHGRQYVVHLRGEVVGDLVNHQLANPASGADHQSAGIAEAGSAAGRHTPPNRPAHLVPLLQHVRHM